MSKFAWVTLTTNDTYSLGALVLANSLKRTCTAHQLAVLVTPNVTEPMKAKLKEAFNIVQEVDVLDSKDEANLALLKRPELGITFTKLHCWRLTQFEKCVFLDADTLVLKNCDELFEREELSAAPDVSWPDCFNSGVFVYRPSLETFKSLVEFATTNGSFDGGDQGLLNQYFADWATKDISKHLPFTYNTAAYASYCYLPAFKQFRDRIKILHFAGKLKPWLASFDSQNKQAHTPQGYEHAADFIQLWWNIFCDDVHQSLQNTMINSTTERYYEQHNFPIISNTIENPIVFHDPWEDYYEKLEKSTNYDIKNNDSYENNVCNNPTLIIDNNCNNTNKSNNDEIILLSHNNTTNNNYNNNNNFNNTQNQDNNDKNICFAIETSNIERFDDNINLNINSSSIDKNYNYNNNDNSNNISKNNNSSNYVNDNNNYYNKIEESISHQRIPTLSIAQQTTQQLLQHHEALNKHKSQQEQPQKPQQPQSLEKISSELDSTNKSNDEKQISDNRNINERLENTFKNNDNNKNSINNLLDSNNLNSNQNLKNSIEDTINEEETGLAGVLSTLRLGEAKSPEQEAYEQSMRRQCWESGNIDYTGKDSFDNIWKKISETIDSKPKSDKQESASM